MYTPMEKRLSFMDECTFEHIEDIEDISLGRGDSGLVEISNQSPQPESRLLSLPLEIRLQIYGHLMDIHPTSSCHLAPNPAEIGSSPQADIPNHLIHQRGRSIPSSFYSSSSSSLLPVEKPPQKISNIASRCLHAPRIHKLPTSFLLCSKKIYFESRAIPFQTNNWVFVNWFNSGLYAATTFIKATKKWQRDSMRFVGLEVGGVELVGCRGGCVSEWEEVCVFLGGGAVWGLRVVVRGRCRGYGALVDAHSINMHGRENLGRGEKRFIENSVLDVRAKWITEGLCRLKSLRYLDVTIADPDFSVEERDAFRNDLELLMGGVEVKVEGVGGEGDGDGEVVMVVEEVEDVNPFGQIYPGLWGGI